MGTEDERDDYEGEEESEYAPRVSSSIQFTDKIIEPDMGVIKRIAKVFPGADLDGFVENFRILFRSITRDYSLGNLSVPKKRFISGSYDFATFVHSEKTIMFLQDRPHLGLACNAILEGELLLSRSINMKQQEIIQSSYIRKDITTNEREKGGLIPQLRK
jgi:hypothetical protein